MRRLGDFVYAIMAGTFIAFGGVAYLNVENKILGAILFSAGLFCVLTQGYNLFTGKVGYYFRNDPKTYIPFLIITYIGNFIGALVVSGLCRYTRMFPVLQKSVTTVVDTKLNDSVMSIFIMAIFCNLFVVMAVEQYLNNPHVVGKYLGILYCIPFFIFCGFEHCVANMFYFSLAGAWSTKAIVYMAVMTVGNIVGGVIVPEVKRFKQYTEVRNK